MKPFIIHGAWILIGAGAYFAGTLNPRMERPGVVTGPQVGVPARPEVPREPSGRSEAAIRLVDESAEVGRWLDSYRGRDGSISADRMRDAVRAAMQDSDPVKATLYFAQLVRELTAENAPAALQAVNEGAAGMDSMRFLSLLAHAWGEKDGPAALAAFDEMRGREANWAKSAALAAWAAADPTASIEWLEARRTNPVPGRDGREDWAMARGILSGLARRDVDSALKYLITLPEGQQGDFVGVLVDQKMKEGVTVGAEWAQQLPTEPMRTSALESVGHQFLRQDTDGAVKWAEAIAARPDAHEAVADVANAMAGRNPQQAADWVARLPAGPSQNHAFEDVFESWTRTDPTAASEALTGMTPGPSRDSAIQAFSRTLARENPNDALTWAAAISDQNERANVQVEIVRRWQSNAPVEAQAWIAANLSPELQARALAPRSP